MKNLLLIWNINDSITAFKSVTSVTSNRRIDKFFQGLNSHVRSCDSLQKGNLGHEMSFKILKNDWFMRNCLNCFVFEKVRQIETVMLKAAHTSSIFTNYFATLFLGHEKRTMVSRLIFLHFWVTFFSWLIMATFPTLFCMSIFFANLDLGSTEFRLKFLSISLSFISSSGRRREAPATPKKNL